MAATLIQHVVGEVCTDPDCEVHNIKVGVEEKTVGMDELAWFIAGAQYMEMSIRRRLLHPATFDNADHDTPIYSRRDLINAALVAGRELNDLATEA
jgi:hypothetical protein